MHLNPENENLAGLDFQPDGNILKGIGNGSGMLEFITGGDMSHLHVFISYVIAELEDMTCH
jgi:hypothetical protein